MRNTSSANESFLGRILLVVAMIAVAVWAVCDEKRYVIGTDLSGGTILEYKLKVDPDRPRNTAANMDELTSALKRRLDPDGLKSYVIRDQGNDRIEITMPRSDDKDVEDVKRRISTVGQLRFRIIADRRRHGPEMTMAERQWPRKQVGDGNTVLAEFVPYGHWIPTARAAEKEKGAKYDWSKSPKTFTVDESLRFVPVSTIEDYKPDAESSYLVHTDEGKKYVLAYYDFDGMHFGPPDNLVKTDPETGVHYVLVHNDQWNVVGDDLRTAEKGVENFKPIVQFTFNVAGADRFAALTDEFKPERDEKKYLLGVVFDNRLRSAANLINKISGGSGQISGFQPEEVAALVKVLSAGKLPVAVERTPERILSIAPTLGQDTIRNGAIAVCISLVAIGLFMVYYYRFAGLVSVCALVLNILFTVALMNMVQATWTLPGLAGLVLTVGMSVDANVLVFERIREELDRGATLTSAIRLGYERAWHPILDSNITSFATAIILYIIGTDQVRGFAVTLVFGIMTGLFTALYCTRIVFDLLYQRRWLRGFHFRRFLNKPNYNFLRWRGRAAVISSILILLGMTALASRWGNNFDIDFTGGTMADMRFTKTLQTSDVRRMAAEAGVKEPAVEQVSLTGVEPGRYFRVRTTEKETAEGDDVVRRKLAAAFKDYMEFVKVKATTPKPIPVAPKAEPGQPAPAADPFLTNFVGGSETEVTLSEPRPESYLRGKFDDVLKGEIAQLTDSRSIIGIEPKGEADATTVGAKGAERYTKFRIAANRTDLPQLIEKINQRLAASPEFEQFSSFGPQVAGEMQLRAVAAVFFSWLFIIGWVGYRFSSWSFGLGGVAALVHDVLMSLGLVAIFSTLGAHFPWLEKVLITEMKINLDMIAAILTLIGYSIHDTIVTFDRVREIRGKGTRVSEDMINRAINETLSRTIITSALTWSSVVILFIGGGAALRGFAFLLVVGLMSGTYSTIFIANPVVLLILRYQERKSGRSLNTSGSKLPAAV